MHIIIKYGGLYNINVNQSRIVLENKYRSLPLVPGWVTTLVHSGKNLSTHTRVANQPLPTVTLTIAIGHS